MASRTRKVLKSMLRPRSMTRKFLKSTSRPRFRTRRFLKIVSRPRSKTRKFCKGNHPHCSWELPCPFLLYNLIWDTLKTQTFQIALQTLHPHPNWVSSTYILYTTMTISKLHFPRDTWPSRITLDAEKDNSWLLVNERDWHCTESMMVSKGISSIESSIRHYKTPPAA